MTTTRPQARRSVVSFHAHPDDETLLTGGSLAKAAADGHNVVLVTATAGEAGLAAPRFAHTAGGLGMSRMAELRRAADVLGCSRVVLLGYADSGMRGESGGDQAFASADVQAAALRLADVLQRERADVLTIYDQYGGYGHPDHVQVHRVGVRAAELAATAVVLEATVDRDLARRAMRLRTWLRPGSRLEFPPVDQLFSARSSLTHRIDVRRHLGAKRAAMAAHASQRTGDGDERSLALFLRLPPPVFRLAFGHEWFVQRVRDPALPVLGDIFAGLAERDP